MLNSIPVYVVKLGWHHQSVMEVGWIRMKLESSLDLMDDLHLQFNSPVCVCPLAQLPSAIKVRSNIGVILLVALFDVIWFDPYFYPIQSEMGKYVLRT